MGDRPKPLSHHWLPPRFINRKLDWQMESGLNPRNSEMECGCPKQQLNLQHNNAHLVYTTFQYSLLTLMPASMFCNCLVDGWLEGKSLALLDQCTHPILVDQTVALLSELERWSNGITRPQVPCPDSSGPTSHLPLDKVLHLLGFSFLLCKNKYQSR